MSKFASPIWGQLVCGPPGSGKTTYCAAIKAFLTEACRPTIIVNLDPANDAAPYECAINIYDLVSLDDVTAAYELGPNGGMMYCIEFLEKNLDWLDTQLDRHTDKYVVFDCPGQAELFTHHPAFYNIVQHLQKRDMRLCAVHLVDSHHCLEAAKFIAVSLISLMTMIRLELPHINVLSKVDMIPSYGELPFSLEFFTDGLDMNELSSAVGDDSTIGHIRRRTREKLRDARLPTEGSDGAESVDAESSGESEGESGEPTSGYATAARRHRKTFLDKYRRLNAKLGEVIEDFNLLAFIPMSVKEPTSMLRVIKAVDKAHGFVPVHSASGRDAVVETPLQEWDFEKHAGLEEKYTNKFGYESDD